MLINLFDFRKKIMKGKSSTDALVIILKYSFIPEVFPDRQKQAYLECLITNKICCRFDGRSKHEINFMHWNIIYQMRLTFKKLFYNNIIFL